MVLLDLDGSHLNVSKAHLYSKQHPLSPYLQKVLGDEMSTNKCLGFLYMRPGDKVVLLDGKSPLWIGIVTNKILIQENYQFLGLSHLFRSIKWQDQIKDLTFAQMQTNKAHHTVHTAVRNTILDEISVENPDLSCELENIHFIGKTLETPKQGFSKFLFTQRHTEKTLHYQYIEQRAKVLIPQLTP